MQPWFGRSLLEVGAGLGEFAAQVRGLARHVVTDVDPQAVAALARRFAGRTEAEARVLDLAADPVAEIGEPVEAVLAINVLEHIEDDAEALRRMAALVTPGGRVVIWVPGYQQLYGEFDRAARTRCRATRRPPCVPGVRAGRAPSPSRSSR